MAGKQRRVYEPLWKVQPVTSWECAYCHRTLETPMRFEFPRFAGPPDSYFACSFDHAYAADRKLHPENSGMGCGGFGPDPDSAFGGEGR